jgi:uncharacterized protein DUF3891
MIIQTAPAGEPRRAIMMHEHTALAGQFARAFGNDGFAPIEPADEMTYVIAHHDAGWSAFDRDPATDEKTGLPYNLVETPVAQIARTSAGSPDFNQRHHPYCGLISSMHSWGLYNGRYGISNLVLIEKIAPHERPVAEGMLAGELARQERLKAEIAQDPQASAWLDQRHVFQNYKQLQFCDTLALYFNRVHAAARGEQTFTHVPRNADEDAAVTIRPLGASAYALAPYPFATNAAEFAFAGRAIVPHQHEQPGGWPAVLREAPTEWECFRLVAA